MLLVIIKIALIVSFVYGCYEAIMLSIEDDDRCAVKYKQLQEPI